MPQSLANVYVHCVFSVKDRAPRITDDIRPKLHGYMSGVLRGVGCEAVVVGGVDDHVHILFRLPRDKSLSSVVGAVKERSTKWLRMQGAAFADFSWQRGFSAFSVSESNVGKVREYIARQREHHARVSFEDECRKLLTLNNIPFDEEHFLD